MAGTKENIVQMIKALKDQNLNVTFDAYSIELILPAQVRRLSNWKLDKEGNSLSASQYRQKDQKNYSVIIRPSYCCL